MKYLSEEQIVKYPVLAENGGFRIVIPDVPISPDWIANVLFMAMHFPTLARYMMGKVPAVRCVLPDSSADLWGILLTAKDINAADFGILLRAEGMEGRWLQ